MNSLVLTEVITFVLLLIVFLLFFGRIRRGISRLRQTMDGKESDAREILDGRYANGEISREDYLIVKGDITGRNDA